MPCSNAAKTQNPLKIAGVTQTKETISAVSMPKFAILCRYVEDIWLFNKFFFPIVDTCVNYKDIADKFVRWCQDGEFLAIFASCIFSEPRAARFRPVS